MHAQYTKYVASIRKGYMCDVCNVQVDVFQVKTGCHGAGLCV